MTAQLNPEITPTPDKDAPGRASSLLRIALGSMSMKIGLILTALIVLLAVVGPYVSPFSPTEFIGPSYSQPGDAGVFGTDNIGRDILSRFLHGGRILLVLAVIATALGVGLGALVGILAAYQRGWLDDVLMRTNDILLAFPQLVLALLFLSIVGPKLWLIVLMVAIGHLPRTARVIRGAAASVVEADFVKSNEAIGIPKWKIMLTEITPNTSGALAVEFGLRLTYSIGLIAGLSFLGLGLQPPTADWGLMINENRIALTVQPWGVILPVLAIAVLTVGTNLITDGLSHAASGSGRGVEE